MPTEQPKNVKGQMSLPLQSEGSGLVITDNRGSTKPSLAVPTAKEEVIEKLSAKLATFLEQCPEWSVVLALPKQSRDRAAKVLAKQLTTIPHADTKEAFPRAMRRAFGIK